MPYDEDGDGGGVYGGLASQGEGHAGSRIETRHLNADELDEDVKVTPLPYVKILSLSVSRISEGLIYSVILPYINECIHRMGVPEEDVGVWSATAVSLDQCPFTATGGASSIRGGVKPARGSTQVSCFRQSAEDLLGSINVSQG